MRSLERVYHSILIQFSVKNQLNLYEIIGYKFRIKRRNYTTYIHEEQVKLLMLRH
jgi:hypothetical protein